MKISLNWAKQYVDLDMPIDDLVTRIGSRLGEVESVQDLGTKYKDVVIARVVSCEKHPDADKLSVCLLDDGGKRDVERNSDGLVTVVCGAPNVAEGQLVAWLPPGATVPSSVNDEQPFVLDARDLRGVKSNGMIASATELDLWDDHSGILVLDQGEAGDSFAEKFGLDDHIIDIENKMFTHRPDCFGLHGVAREIAGITGSELKRIEGLKADSQVAQENDDLSIVIKAADDVSRLTAAVIDVSVGESTLQRKIELSKVGLKPINNVVDVTNYIMYTTGQPIHAFDYDKFKALSGGAKPQLIARRSTKDEQLTLLGDKQITMDREATVIATDKQAVALGGIMGGKETEVDESTKRIIIECANFNMYDIRRTSMHYGLFTDASNRFNKGQSPQQNLEVLRRSVDQMMDDAGSTGTDSLLDTGAPRDHNQAITVSAEFINARLGADIDAQEMRAMLVRTEFDVQVDGQNLTITAPYWRTDIAIAEDIVEEIGRIYGYDNLQQALPRRSIAPTSIKGLFKTKQRIRQSLSSIGANEALTYSFIPSKLLGAAGQDEQYTYKISNALSPQLQHYRQSLTPNLLDKVNQNIRANHSEFALFEVGQTHSKAHEAVDTDDLPQEIQTTALVYARKDAKGPAAYYVAKRYLESLLKDFGIDEQDVELKAIEQELTPQIAQPFDHTRSALVFAGESMLGIVGEYKQSVESALKLPRQSAGFEIDTTGLHNVVSKSKFKALPEYPVSTQDLTLKLPVKVKYIDISLEIRMLLQDTEYRYELGSASSYYRQGDETKNISFGITLWHDERTLKTEEVSKVIEDIVARAARELSAEQV